MVDPGKPEHPTVPHHRPPLSGRQIIAQIGVAAVILVSGIAIGGGGTILALKNRIVPVIDTQIPERSRSGPDVNELAKISGWLAERWKADYGLSDEQTQQVKETLAGEFAAKERLHREFMAAEETQRQQLTVAMKGILTPEQFARWDADFRQMVEHMKRMRPFDGPQDGRRGPRGDRPDWPPDRRMDPNDRRGGWQPGPPRDPNDRRGDWRRERFRGPDDRRGDGPPGSFMDREGARPPGPLTDPNDPPGDESPERFMGPEGGRPPEPPLDPNG
ncbi:MAG: hypothetical protein ABFE13_03220 [Phycisphaerales bacterium]